MTAKGKKKLSVLVTVVLMLVIAVTGILTLPGIWTELTFYCAGSMDFVLGFQQHFLLTAFTAADGFVDQTGRFQLGRADLLFSDLLAVGNTDHGTQTQTDQTNDDCNNNRSSHKLQHTSFF